MKDGGGEEVWKWQNRAAQPCVDRSSTFCRPVDRRAEADPKRKGERGKGKGKVRDFGAEVVSDLMGQVLSIYRLEGKE